MNTQPERDSVAAIYASVVFFDRCNCSANEIAEFLSLHEWEVREMLKPPPKPKPVYKAEVLWRAPDYHGEGVA